MAGRDFCCRDESLAYKSPSRTPREGLNKYESVDLSFKEGNSYDGNGNLIYA
jgi:hypothetical protein